MQDCPELASVFRHLHISRHLPHLLPVHSAKGTERRDAQSESHAVCITRNTSGIIQQTKFPNPNSIPCLYD